MWDNKQNERFKTFIKAFNIQVGDIIKIPGYFTYEVRENGFYHNQDSYKKGYSQNVYNTIISRGFEKIK